RRPSAQETQSSRAGRARNRHGPGGAVARRAGAWRGRTGEYGFLRPLRLEDRMAQLTEMVPPAAAGALLRAVFGLPGPVTWVTAGAPVRRDGQELALDAQLLVLMSKPDHRSLAGGTPEEARAGIARAKEMLGRVPDRPVRTREVAIADAVTGRLYTPKGLAEG